MSERLDIAIIGSGVAGISAAINAKIRNKSFKIFGNKDMSNKLIKAEKINNYLGFPAISGEELKKHFENHLKEMDIEICEDRINSVYNLGDYYALIGNDNQYEAKTIILAIGVNFGKPFKGEEEFLGRGVGYCATCDAPLYRDKIVTIIAYSKHEEAEADFIASIAKKVYYIPMYKEDVTVDGKIEIIKDRPIEITGDMKIKKLILQNSEIETDGLFILRDSISPNQLLSGLEFDDNHIKVDRNMATNLNGCFAAGDVVGTPYQYIKAAGEGNIAALSAVAYLSKNRL